MKKKKSQMEILGLAIIVVIVLMATLFVVRFVVLRSPIDYRKGFVSSELASNMLNTLLKTSAQDCKQLTMSELIQDCAQETGLECDNGQDSCKFVSSTANWIFGTTLDKWNYKYEFLAYRENDKPFIKLGNQCQSEKRSKLYPIPIRAATVYVKLDICT